MYTETQLTEVARKAARQGAALALQACGVHIKHTDAASLAGVDRRTVGNWMRSSKVRSQGKRVNAGDVLGMMK